MQLLALATHKLTVLDRPTAKASTDCITTQQPIRELLLPGFVTYLGKVMRVAPATI